MSSVAGSPQGLVWCGPVFDPTGYADEGRGMLCALEHAGVPVTLRPANRLAPGFREGLPAGERRTLDRQIARPLPDRQILVQHHTADGFFRVESDAYRVGRTMFETDSIPPTWVRHCNQMDELWLPSQFNIDTFRRAGVHVPMVRVPGGIDSDFFHPGVTPMAVAGLRGTVFLAVFEWRLRKGWDVLLRAWADAFNANDDVTLVLRTYPIDKAAGEDNETVINARIDAFLTEHCGRSRREVAPIVVLGKTVAGSDMPSLYRIATALVAPTRGEGWGRPFMEAMASGVPVIATRWSAHLEFMNDDNSLLLDIDGTEDADGVEVPLYREQRWAAPSRTHLRDLLQRVHAQPVETRALGARARHDMVTLWPWSRAADVMSARLQEIRELTSPHDVILSTSSRSQAHSTHSPSGPRLLVDARLFDSATGESTTDRVIGHLLARWPHRSLVNTHVSAPLRPPMSSPAMHAYRATISSRGSAAKRDSVGDSTLHAREEDIVLTWLDGASTHPMVRPPCAQWIVHTGNRVVHEVPKELVRVLRDSVDDVWVPSFQAYNACLSAGVVESRLWLMPVERAPEYITAEGPRQSLRHRADTIFLLPAVDVAQSAAIDTILKTWQRTFSATQSALLIVYVPEGSTASVQAWHQQLVAVLSSGRLLLGAPIQIFRERLALDELASLVRAADVVLDPFPTAGTMQIVQTAIATNRAVISGCSANDHSAHEDMPVCGSPGSSWHVSQTSGTSAANAWRDALRSASDREERARRVSNASELAITLHSAADIAGAAAQRIAHCGRPENARHLALVANQVEPFAVQDVRATTILAHIDWHDGTGSGVVQSYMRTFSNTDDLSLVLCLDPAQGITLEQVVLLVHDAMHAAGKDDATAPDIVLIPDLLSDEVRRALLARCDAVVSMNDPILTRAASESGRRSITNLSASAWRGAVRGPLVSA